MSRAPMKGLHLSNGHAELRPDLPRPEPRDGWSRVQVVRAGVCATDLALKNGYMGFAGVPGHEFVGVALEGPLQGQRVVGEINAACGQCDRCRHNQDRHCPNRSVLGILGLSGAFAEELALPDRNLLPVPEAISDDAATFTEPLAAGFQIADQVDVADRSILVAGDGRLGLLCAHALHASGAKVTVAGRHPDRSDLLPRGVALHTDLLESDAVAPDHAFDIAVEATGSPAVLPRLLGWVRPQGVVVLKTTTERPVTADLSLVVVNELTLLGSRCGRFEPALELLATGAVPTRDLVSARYGLGEAVTALDHAGRSGTLKVLLDV